MEANEASADGKDRDFDIPVFLFLRLFTVEQPTLDCCRAFPE